MFNLISNEIINTKKLRKFDLPFFSRANKREEILSMELLINPTYSPSSGLSNVNTYKSTYDLFMAKRRVDLEYYKNSILWSTKYKPFHFIYLFAVPMTFAVLFSYYSLNYSMEKKMMLTKQRLGVIYPEYEKKGVFKIWTQETYIDEIYGDIFQKKEMEVYNQKYKKVDNKEPELLKKNKHYRKLLNYKLQKIAFEKNLTQK